MCRESRFGVRRTRSVVARPQKAGSLAPTLFGPLALETLHGPCPFGPAFCEIPKLSDCCPELGAGVFDLVVFLDGDTYMGPGMLAKTHSGRAWPLVG